ncbi:hypothetical protein HZH66_010247 [Vespula vulgaris]|uniref:Uncharacterized protein n=1 Tax=Vespula vulgaris TaxID=7454 RepID=A0A834JJA7_VESVU|nr:hypothetical protein HZH66_010247 [Vespula vulgaris]
MERAHGTGSWNGLMERAHGTGSWNGLIERDRARVHVRAHGMGSCMGSWNGLMQGLMYGLMSIQKIVLSLSRSTWNRCEKTVARATFPSMLCLSMVIFIYFEQSQSHPRILGGTYTWRQRRNVDVEVSTEGSSFRYTICYLYPGQAEDQIG